MQQNMQQYRGPVPTPGRRRPAPSSPPSSPADHHHMMSTACKSDVVNSASSSREKKRIRVDVADDVNSSSSSSSSCCLLPLDVIRSILAKLPARSILRFRSVSKSWNQLIYEPAFVELQLAEANKKPPSRILVLTNHNFNPDPTNKIALHALAEEGEEEEEEGEPRRRLLFERQLASNESSTMMLPYDCDGLVLFYSITDIWVCNPSTRETLPLPGFTTCDDGWPLFRNPVQCLGFGLDPVSNLYKVVRFYLHSFQLESWEVGCEVFALGEFQSWRQIEEATSFRFCPRQDSVSANGSLYWITNDFSLLSFDLGNEAIGQLLPPSAAMVYPPHNFPTQRKGDTFIIKGGGGGGDERLWYVKVNRDDFTFDIWEMKNRTEEPWTSIHRISFQTLATERILAIPMLVVRDGRCILLSNQEKLQRYDVVSKEYKTMLTIEGDDPEPQEGDADRVDGATLLCPCVHRETLVSLKATNY